jgi:hypothetical protein
MAYEWFPMRGILQKPIGDEKVVALKESQYIEVLIGSMTQDEPSEQLEDLTEALLNLGLNYP